MKGISTSVLIHNPQGIVRKNRPSRSDESGAADLPDESLRLLYYSGVAFARHNIFPITQILSPSGEQSSESVLV